MFRNRGLRFSHKGKMIFVGGLAFYLMEDGGCEGFEKIMECEGLGRRKIKNELECKGLRGRA